MLLNATVKPLTPPEAHIVYKAIHEVGEFKHVMAVHYAYKPPKLRRYAAGYAAHYGPGLMERVARKRKMSVVPCMISSPTIELGIWVYIYSQNTGDMFHCRVTDVSAPQDRKRHIRNKLIAELSFAVTAHICGSTTLANRECPILILLTN